ILLFPLPLWERVARRRKPPSRVRGSSAPNRFYPSPGSSLAHARNEPPSPTRGEGKRVCSSRKPYVSRLHFTGTCSSSLCARKSLPQPHPNVLVVGTAKHGVCFRDGGQ